ncbi:MAG TPA: cytochrome c maturation protein CcmE [Acidobacteriaceae bacterium]
MNQRKQQIRIGIAIAIFVAVIVALAVTGTQSDKSYYVTINELQQMGGKAYTRHLRVAGNVQPGSIEHRGTSATFVLVENDRRLAVAYQGVEPPPDTFKDNSQALAIGTYGRDGVFHATQLQAKCASKYAPAPGATPAPAAARTPRAASSSTPPAAPPSSATATPRPAA